jgi:murein DD-endopeptidase MepM/ murein hydrolase activator NlpD
MPFYILDDGLQFDVSQYVQRETVQYHSSLSVDIDAHGGESTFSCQMVIDPSTDFKPRAGSILTWVSDNVSDLTIFSGVISDAIQIQAGFGEIFARVMQYQVSARDASVLMEKKITEPGIYNQKWTEGATDPEKIKPDVTGNSRDGFQVSIKTDQHQFPDFIGNNPGELIDLLAIASDPRYGLPTDNDTAATDDFALPFDYEIGRMTHKDAIDQICREAGLLWWVDAEWNFHHQSFPKIYNTRQDSFFDINDDVDNKNFYGFEFREDIEKWVSRVKVIGNVLDAGDVNQENRRQGKQKKEEVIVTVTSSLENINAIRARIGASPLAEGTNVEELPDSEPGIWMTTVNAPDVYLQKESGDSDPTKPDYSLLQQIGEAYLLRYGQPDIVGSVFYNDRPPVIGASININSFHRGIDDLTVPVIEVEVDSAGDHQGNDEIGDRVYTYRAQFRGPSMKLRYARLGTGAEIVKIRKERLLKPSPPDILGADIYAEASGEILDQIQVSTTVTATIVTPDYNISGTPYGGITDEYPVFTDGGSEPVAPSPGYEQTRKYYPPIKQPWTITDGFGTRTHPVTGVANSDHTAIDISAAIGTPIYAILDGVVAVAESNPHINLAGKYIKINLTDGSQALYAHLSKIIVKKGQSIKRGQILGYTGNTGRSTGPHLHFGLKKGGVPVNPTGFTYYDDRET